MARRKKEPETFSATKAVKANARTRLGTPPPGTPIPDRREKQARGPIKHKQSMEDLIAGARQGKEA